MKCRYCDTWFVAESIPWAFNRSTKEDAAGCGDSDLTHGLSPWYGADGKRWPIEEAVMYDVPVAAPGCFGLCDECTASKLESELLTSGNTPAKEKNACR